MDALVDLTIKLCILPISSKILKSFLARLILINLQLSSFSNAFCLLSHSQYLCYYALVHQLLLLIYTWENMHQFYNFKHFVAVFLQLQIMSQFLTILIVLESLLDHAV